MSEKETRPINAFNSLLSEFQSRNALPQVKHLSGKTEDMDTFSSIIPGFQSIHPTCQFKELLEFQVPHPLLQEKDMPQKRTDMNVFRDQLPAFITMHLSCQLKDLAEFSMLLRFSQEKDIHEERCWMHLTVCCLNFNQPILQIKKKISLNFSHHIQ